MSRRVCVLPGDGIGPEVIGETGIQVDPEDEDALESGLAALLDDRDGALERANAACVRAEGFTWAKSAESLAAVYGKLM